MPGNGSAQPGNGLPIRHGETLPHADDHAVAPLVNASPKSGEDKLALVSTMYLDGEIDSVLGRIDTAVRNCHPSHAEDAADICKRSHKAVNTVRKFRGEVMAKTTEVLKEGEVEMVQPGDGPKELQETLQRVLMYTEARSLVVLGAVSFVQMERYREGESRPNLEETRVVAEATETFRQIITEAPQEKPAGKPLNSRRLDKQLTRAVRLHVERVVENAEVRALYNSLTNIP